MINYISVVLLLISSFAYSASGENMENPSVVAPEWCDLVEQSARQIIKMAQSHVPFQAMHEAIDDRDSLSPEKKEKMHELVRTAEQSSAKNEAPSVWFSRISHNCRDAI